MTIWGLLAIKAATLGMLVALDSARGRMNECLHGVEPWEFRFPSPWRILKAWAGLFKGPTQSWSVAAWGWVWLVAYVVFITLWLYLKP